MALMTETAAQPKSSPDRRRAERAALRLNATMREAGRGRVTARVIDISTHGCRIEAGSGASVETWLWLSIAGLETQYCRVIWRCQEFAGLEFATPLSEPVLERLLADTKQLTESTITELRDIASRTHRLSSKGEGEDTATLAELSRKCAVEAVVEGFRLSEAKAGAATPKGS